MYYVLKVKSRNREELVEFTDLVREKLKESGQREGIVVYFTFNTPPRASRSTRMPTRMCRATCCTRSAL